MVSVVTVTPCLAVVRIYFSIGRLICAHRCMLMHDGDKVIKFMCVVCVTLHVCLDVGVCVPTCMYTGMHV